MGIKTLLKRLLVIGVLVVFILILVGSISKYLGWSFLYYYVPIFLGGILSTIALLVAIATISDIISRLTGWLASKTSKLANTLAKIITFNNIKTPIVVFTPRAIHSEFLPPKTKEEQAKEQQAKEQQAKEQQAKKAKEQQAKEQQAKEQQAKEQQAKKQQNNSGGGHNNNEIDGSNIWDAISAAIETNALLQEANSLGVKEEIVKWVDSGGKVTPNDPEKAAKIKQLVAKHNLYHIIKPANNKGGKTPNKGGSKPNNRNQK